MPRKTPSYESKNSEERKGKETAFLRGGETNKSPWMRKAYLSKKKKTGFWRGKGMRGTLQKACLLLQKKRQSVASYQGHMRGGGGGSGAKGA